MITDDYASFFNQLRLSKSEYPKTGAMHPPRAGQEQASFACDTVLGLSIKMASNVAQRFADLLVHIFKQKVEPTMNKLTEKYCQSSDEFAAWVDSRRSIENNDKSMPVLSSWWQAAICQIFMYTDDPCILCGGGRHDL